MATRRMYMSEEERKAHDYNKQKLWREAHSDYVNQQARKNHARRVAEDPEGYRAAKAKAAKKYLASLSPERKEEIRKRQRQYRLKRQYSLSAEQFTDMFQRQGNACALCKSSTTAHHWAVDHNHKTGAVRAILCHNCNVGIGHLQDNPELLRSAANYIERHDTK